MSLKKRVSLTGFCLVGMIILGTLVQQVALLAFPTIKDSVFFLLITNYLGMYGLGLPLFFTVLKKFPKSELKASDEVSTKEWGTLILMGLGIMYLVNLVFGLLMSLISGGSGNVLGEMISGFKLWQVLLLVVLTAPVLEELVFRKLLYQVAAPLGDKGYIIFSSILFGLYHMNISQSIYAFFLGVILSYLYVKTGNLKMSILTHITINFIGSFIPMLMTSSAVMTTVFVVFVLLVMIIGLITISKNKRAIKNYFRNEDDVATFNWKEIFLNPGMVVFIIFCSVMIIVTFSMAFK